ncbi:MAG: HPr(Ser) kinase/phosphatase [Clostridiales bacterium]|nr:HPr(Ser) kinase/phosphatase [Clostridiales bacterium]
MPVNIKKFIEDLNLEVVVEGKEDREIEVNDIIRPGLQFVGQYEYFVNTRIQIVGNAEWHYLNSLEPDVRRQRLEKYFEYDMPCIVFSRNLNPHYEFIELAREKKIWILRSTRDTTRLVNRIINYLDRALAKTTTMHGVLVDVYGVGILITGESGIGKSEVALELIKRGHMLVTDDAVEIKLVDGILYGTSPYITSGMLEVRGMGIINIQTLYGLSSILEEKTIDLVIHLEQWREHEDYDRVGMPEYINILNIPVRRMRMPVKPGRNIAVIIEAAAANFRYGRMMLEAPIDTINRRIDEVMRGEK